MDTLCTFFFYCVFGLCLLPIVGVHRKGWCWSWKLQYFGHLIRRVDSLEKTLMLGGIGGRRRRGQQRMRCLDGITDSMGMSLNNSGSWWWTRKPGMLWFMGSQRVGHDWVTELNWTDGLHVCAFPKCVYSVFKPQCYSILKWIFGR